MLELKGNMKGNMKVNKTMTVIRKATGRVVDRDVDFENLELVLDCQPIGVYDVEDGEGNLLWIAVVKRNGIRFDKPVLQGII